MTSIDCALRTLSNLKDLHSELSIFKQTKGQNQSLTRHFNLLKELIEYLTNLIMRKLKPELAQLKTREHQDQNNPIGGNDDQANTDDNFENISD
jgi:hypothetical protein